MDPSPSPPPPHQSIRTRVALVVSGVAAAVALLFAVAAYQEVRDSAVTLAAERVSAAAAPLAASISGSGEQLEAGARALASLPEIARWFASPEPSDPEALRARIEGVELPGDPVVELRTPGGERVFSSDTLLPPPGAGIGVPAGEGEAWVGPLVPHADVEGHPRIFYSSSARVATPDGTPLGTVTQWRVVDTPAASLATIATLISPGARIYLADLEAGVWTDFRTQVPGHRLESATPPSPGFYRVSHGDTGSAFVAALVALPTPWMVLVEVPGSEVLAGPQAVLRWFLLTGVILVLLAGVAGWFLAGRLTSGLTTLAGAAQALSQGKEEVRVPVTRQDEVGLLGHTFNQMAERVQRSRQALEAALEESSGRESEAREVRDQLAHVVASSRAVLFRHPLPAGDAPPPVHPPFRWVSENLRWLFALEPADAEAAGWFEMRVHPDDREPLRSALAGLAETESVVMEYRLLHGDGRYRWVRDERRVRTDRQAPPSVPVSRSAEVVGVLTDVTRSRELEAARVAAEGANRAKTEFLSRMSHELRTPLTAVLGFGQLLEEALEDPEQRGQATQVLRAGEHLLGLIDEVLDMTGIEAGRIRMEARAVPVEPVVAEAMELVRFQARDRAVVLSPLPRSVDGPSGSRVDPVLADPRRLRQILVNLLSNGIKYNVPGGRVGVEIEDEPEVALVNGENGTGSGGSIRITVWDTGRGIAEAEHARLFIPFDRLGMEEREPEGTGLGLPLSRALAEAMGGTLTVTSQVGSGSRFTLTLPGAPIPPRSGALADTTPEEAAPAEVRGEGPELVEGQVLLVEDHPANLALFRRIFRKRPGITLHVADRGADAIELAREHRPDLVLLDLNLPDMGGDRVLSALRDDPETAGIRVIMISGDASPAQAERLLALGAQDYLFKPFGVKQLLERVDRALGGGTG